MLMIGLMSGTSVDAIDAALVVVVREGDTLFLTVRAFLMQSFDPALRERVRGLLPPSSGSTAEVCEVNALLGEAFAQAALAVAAAADIPIDAVDLIASHGQTVYHQVAPGAVRSTLQLGTPAVIAERTGCTVTADFRPRDIAAGGQGAPLAPYLDALLFADEQISRAIQNIGGIGNVTYLPAADHRPPTTDHRPSRIEDGASDSIEDQSSDPRSSIFDSVARRLPALSEGERSVVGRRSSVVAFDTGPGNMLLDEAVRLLTDGAANFDRDGRMAAAGRVDEALLAEWLAHPFFQQPPPRSTGREQWGQAAARRYLAQAQARGLAPEEVVATLTALTARSIAEAYGRYLGRVDEALVGGGGARNPALMTMLRAALPATHVRPIDDMGLDADAKEAVLFAVLGYATLHGWTNNLPAATGANHPVVLGSITPGANYRVLLARVLAGPHTPAQRVRLSGGKLSV
jgi:anhydro-N-acetylmuramic acid kinase